MFSGIVETTSQVLSARKNPGTVVISVATPIDFNDLAIGHSVCVNGVCLTVNNLSENKIEFVLGPETLKVTGWSEENILGARVNLERSLQFGDRIHGHLVSGHVDGQVEVVNVEFAGVSRIISFTAPKNLKKFVIEKGSITLNGVSLTVNSVDESDFSVCLIPETLRRTNLGNLIKGSKINFEADYVLRAMENLRVYANE